jgi:GMP synthase (glutamine-hydrolysing)
MAESSCFGCVAVINASHQFLHGTTTVPLDKRDPNSRTRVTKILSMTTNPEEKRKIIGDIFVKVSHFVCVTVIPVHVCGH